MSTTKVTDEEAKSATMSELMMRVKALNDAPNDECAFYWPGRQEPKMLVFKAEFADSKFLTHDDIKDICYVAENKVCLGDSPSDSYGNIKSVHYLSSHFANGKLGKVTSIEIPTTNENSGDVTKTAAYLAVQTFKNGNPIGEIIYSDNNPTFEDTGESGNSYVFNFVNNELILEDYDVIKLAFVGSKSETIDSTTFIPSGEHVFRVSAIETTDSNDGVCCVYTSNNALKRWYVSIKVTIEFTEVHTHTPEMHITPEERERWNNNAAVQTGINIGTEDNPINPAARIEGEGFLKGVTAINFRGAFVNVVKEDAKTITVWINKDNNFPEVSTASSSGVTTSTKYVFGSSTNAWQLPAKVTNGGSFSSCHPISEDQKITLNGYKEGKE